MKLRQYIVQQLIRYLPHGNTIQLNENSVSFEVLCEMIRIGEEFEFDFRGLTYAIVQYEDKKELYEVFGDSESRLISTFKSVEDFRTNVQINGENLGEAWERKFLENHQK